MKKKLNFIYSRLTSNSIYSHKFRKIGVNSFIHSSAKVNNSNEIEIGSEVTIQDYCWLNSITNMGKLGKIIIGSGANIGRFCTISSATKIEIEKNVLLGMNIYIADHEHNYEDINKPILGQGISAGKGIIICKNSWIGTNTVILSKENIRVGKNSIVGANSVVKNSVPDYCLAVGSPAKVIKKYNKTKKRWVKV